MKTHLLKTASLIIAAMALSLTSCKKETIETQDTDTKTIKQLSVDENLVDQAVDETIQDVESGQGNGTSGLKSAEVFGQPPCNVDIDTVVNLQTDTVKLVYTYHGVNCQGTRDRSGVIEVSKKIGTHWIQAGATLRIRYINFTVTRLADSSTLVFNGLRSHTNVSGGVIPQLLAGTVSSIVHRTSGDMQITFSDGTTRIWSMARQRTYTGTAQNLLCTIEGFGSQGTYQNLVCWGLNRNGEQFYSQIQQSLVLSQTCNWEPVSGVKKNEIPSVSKSATITFGYNSNNEPIVPGECPTRFKVDWVNGNQSGTFYLPLH